MIRHTLWLIAAIAAAAALAGGCQEAPVESAEPVAGRGPEAKPASLSPLSPADLKAKEGLALVVPEVRFIQLPLADVLASLSERTGLEFRVNWPIIEQAGVTRSTPVTLMLRDVTWQTVLSEALAKAGERWDTLDYMVRDGVVRVSTTDELGRQFYVLVYDVRDLSPWVSHDPLITQNGVTDLLSLVRRNVLPDNWEPDGPGRLDQADGLLVVRHNQYGHREVARYIAGLNERGRVQIALEAQSLLAPLDAATRAAAAIGLEGKPTDGQAFDRLTVLGVLDRDGHDRLLGALLPGEKPVCPTARIVLLTGQGGYLSAEVPRTPGAGTAPLTSALTSELAGLRSAYMAVRLYPSEDRLRAMAVICPVFREDDPPGEFDFASGAPAADQRRAVKPESQPDGAGGGPAPRMRLETGIADVSKTVAVPDGQTLVLSLPVAERGRWEPDDKRVLVFLLRPSNLFPCGLEPAR